MNSKGIQSCFRHPSTTLFTKSIHGPKMASDQPFTKHKNETLSLPAEPSREEPRFAPDAPTFANVWRESATRRSSWRQRGSAVLPEVL